MTLQRNKNNLGLGVALNQGIKLAVEAGFPWILTLDQDSRPAAGMLPALLEAYHSSPGADSIALIAPVLKDETIAYRYRSLIAPNRWFFRRQTCDTGVLEDVLMVLHSGALHNARVLEGLGGFREDFFIDYLDTEYCLRARLAGFRILVACEARIQHRLGDRQRRRLGPFTLFPTFHSPQRWYTISRNRIAMLRLYMRRLPNWFFFEISSSLFIILRMLLLEDHRGLKLKALVRGTMDGLRRRMGPIPADVQAMLERT
jgi:rhamnosyltransferase